jgi:hypothetical protein
MTLVFSTLNEIIFFSCGIWRSENSCRQNKKSWHSYVTIFFKCFLYSFFVNFFETLYRNGNVLFLAKKKQILKILAQLCNSGYLGCGAFGGHRVLMLLVQAIAAQICEIVRFSFSVCYCDFYDECFFF